VLAPLLTVNEEKSPLPLCGVTTEKLFAKSLIGGPYMCTPSKSLVGRAFRDFTERRESALPVNEN
jgi:hypothetical protein